MLDGKRRERLGDFTAGPRTLPLAALAVALGVLGAYVATALLALIAFFTNLFFFQRLSFAPASPAGHTWACSGVLVPVVGCLIIGLMARYGSERIRGHGIPEALEAILIRGSRIQPRVALLKPISSAISIGSGGPFGAEGPIIMTGGAFGSIIAQLFHLTAAERKTLLVAGAAAGMSATFASPIAAVLLAVELLLFELKPRSLVPVALAERAARRCAPLPAGRRAAVPGARHRRWRSSPAGPLACVRGRRAARRRPVGDADRGGLRAPRTRSGGCALHWMWWPALGGLVVGLGGLVCPQALGVGYDQIQALLRRRQRASGRRCGSMVGQGDDLGGLARLGHVGRRARAAADDGQRARRARGAVPARVRRRFWPLVSMAAILARHDARAADGAGVRDRADRAVQRWRCRS